jgi:hypothetical protein
MDTGLIIAIAVAALIIIALLVLLPRMTAGAKRKKAERELMQRRETVAGEHRSEARERQQRAEMAEQKARMAQQAAERERAEAGLMEERATMHERGLADHELVEEHERDRFADVIETRSSTDRDGDGHTVDDRARDALRRDDGIDRQQGSVSADEGRFERVERTRITQDVRDSDGMPPR